MIWRSHVHAHCGGPKLQPHVHRPVALARINGLYSTIDIILQHGRIGAHEPTTLVLMPLVILLSTKQTKHLIRTLPDLGPVRLTE